MLAVAEVEHPLEQQGGLAGLAVLGQPPRLLAQPRRVVGSGRRVR
ncbi:hypothetical protein [Actinomadura sp. J1-007]|nr:hypothetical protein [Actinomadura sp. J1-007]